MKQLHMYPVSILVYYAFNVFYSKKSMLKKFVTFYGILLLLFSKHEVKQNNFTVFPLKKKKHNQFKVLFKKDITH